MLVVKRRSLLAIVALACLCVGCYQTGDNSGAGDELLLDIEDQQADANNKQAEVDSEQTDQDKRWYNTDVFRPLLGDFDPAFGFSIHDYEEVQSLLVQGQYLAKISACGSCHGANPSDPKSVLSGGREITDSYGVVLAANITPDPVTGIGGWNVGEINRAIRASIDRRGRALSLDVHEGYRWMSDRDSKSIALFLLSQKPVSHPIERRDLGGFKRRKWGLVSRHEDFEGYVPALPAKATPQFGRYLAHNVSGCKRCHTPETGVDSGEKLFAGHQGQRRSLFSALGRLVASASEDPADKAQKQEQIRSLLSPEGENVYQQRIAEPEEESFGDVITKEVSELVKPFTEEEVDLSFPQLGPDIRGNSPDGLTDWDVDDLQRYLSSGRNPDGEISDSALCPWNYFEGLNDLDRRAIAVYIKSL